MAYNKRPDARMLKALYGDLLDNPDANDEVPIEFGGDFKNTAKYKFQVITDFAIPPPMTVQDPLPAFYHAKFACMT